MEVWFFPEKFCLGLESARMYVAKKSMEQKCLCARFSPKKWVHWHAQEDETLLFFTSCSSATVPSPDGTGVGKLLRWAWLGI